MIIKILNLIAFKIGWMACVLGAAAGKPWLGPLVVAMLAAMHLGLHRFPESRRSELLMLLAAGAVGYVFDSALVLCGVLSFPIESTLGGPSSAWMVALWINLALTLHVSMRWLHGRYVIALLLGAISGPVAYLGGARLGAVFITPGWMPLAAIAATWAVAMPVLVAMADTATRRGRADAEPTQAIVAETQA